MNKFLIIRFAFCRRIYNSLILCKPKNNSTEYRITVMNGDIEKQLCNNNTIREIKGRLHVEVGSNKLQHQLKLKIAKALGKFIGKPVEEVETFGGRLITADLPIEAMKR